MTTAAAIPVGEHLYDADMQFTRFSDYGVRLQDLNSGRVIPPPAGASETPTEGRQWPNSTSRR